ncbi:phosphotransferase family protein [Kineosporia babensis]|uniref:phosphotransferase family protein n=1 Tax=Kineosporia babensis TaxID=499548 RepID=UPI0038B3DDE1
MESITKNRQPVAVLRAMVERAFGAGLVSPAGDDWVTELGHGWFNVVYRIELQDGRTVILKIAPPADVEVMSYERGAMATELSALRLIGEQSDVPVPTVEFADQSHELCDADYFFMSFVDADNLGILLGQDAVSPAERDQYAEALGGLNRRLNQIPGPWFGPLDGPGETTWRACFLRRLDEVLEDGERRKVELGLTYDLVRAAIAERADALDEVTEPRFVEWDLFPNNAMVQDGAIVSLIDHERAFYGDPLIEAGFIGIDMPNFGDPGAFLRGYGQGPLSAGERHRRWLYSLYLALVMVVETEYRQLEPEHAETCRDRLRALYAGRSGTPTARTDHGTSTAPDRITAANTRHDTSQELASYSAPALSAPTSPPSSTAAS